MEQDLVFDLAALDQGESRRNHQAMIPDGVLHMRNAQFAEDTEPLLAECACIVHEHHGLKDCLGYQGNIHKYIRTDSPGSYVQSSACRLQHCYHSRSSLCT